MSLIRYTAKDYKNIRMYCKDNHINFINANILYDYYETEYAINLCFEGDYLIMYISRIIPDDSKSYFTYKTKNIHKIEVHNEMIDYNILDELDMFFSKIKK